jgi:ribosome-binding protein aMBF1 (putative translation factor)
MPNQEATTDLGTAMREAGITNRELAWRVKVDQATVSRWRSGAMPREERRRKAIARHVGLREEDLWPK